jgi:hypothetical protein
MIDFFAKSFKCHFSFYYFFMEVKVEKLKKKRVKTADFEKDRKIKKGENENVRTVLGGQLPTKLCTKKTKKLIK